MEACKQNLKDLGSKRPSTAEQSQYLMGIALEFQKLSTEALSSNYECTDLFDRMPTLRLANAVVHRGEQMSETMTTRGHKIHFGSSNSHQEHGKQSRNSEDDGEQDLDLANLDLDHEPKGIIKTRYLESHSYLEDVIHENITLCEPYSGSIQA